MEPTGLALCRPSSHICPALLGCSCGREGPAEGSAETVTLNARLLSFNALPSDVPIPSPSRLVVCCFCLLHYTTTWKDMKSLFFFSSPPPLLLPRVNKQTNKQTKRNVKRWCQLQHWKGWRNRYPGKAMAVTGVAPRGDGLIAVSLRGAVWGWWDSNKQKETKRNIPDREPVWLFLCVLSSNYKSGASNKNDTAENLS